LIKSKKEVKPAKKVEPVIKVAEEKPAVNYDVMSPKQRRDYDLEMRLKGK